MVEVWYSSYTRSIDSVRYQEVIRSPAGLEPETSCTEANLGHYFLTVAYMNIIQFHATDCSRIVSCGGFKTFRPNSPIRCFKKEESLDPA
jgi:hypothetical protein